MPRGVVRIPVVQVETRESITDAVQTSWTVDFDDCLYGTPIRGISLQRRVEEWPSIGVTVRTQPSYQFEDPILHFLRRYELRDQMVKNHRLGRGRSDEIPQIVRASAIHLSIVDIVGPTGIQDDVEVWRGIVLLEVEDGAAEAVADDAAEFGWVQAVAAFQGAWAGRKGGT